LTLADLFPKSCKKIYVHQITKQDLQAFDSFLLKRGDSDRTRANRVEHLTTFLINKEGRRAGPPILGIGITIKYVEAPPEAYTQHDLEELFRVSLDEDRLIKTSGCDGLPCFARNSLRIQFMIPEDFEGLTLGVIVNARQSYQSRIARTYGRD
jgi:hypothetical protein